MAPTAVSHLVWDVYEIEMFFNLFFGWWLWCRVFLLSVMLSKSYLANKKIHPLNNIGTRGISHVLCNQSEDVLFVRHFFPHFEVNRVYSNEEYNQRKSSARFEFESVLFVVFMVWHPYLLVSLAWSLAFLSCFIFIFSTCSSFDSKYAETQARCCWLGFMEEWSAQLSSSKIIVSDPFNVSEGDECSIQGTDPATKRPILFHGHVLGIFGE